ncbi:MAG TPA: ribosomal-protein-alanine N-acetyltransferase [Gemmatimonas aurantiaca]|nr:ribosomal-protein-alanine N-acetyltransferase [Gemmatimonas aurantiaca]
MGERCRRCCHCRSTPDDGVTDSPDPTGDEARTGVPIAVYIRAMSPDDVDVVSGIEARSFSDPWPPNAFTVLLRRAHARLRVAVDAQGSVVGYCALLIALDEREVANICVDPSVRGKGVAGVLLDEALASADETLASAVFLEVRESNTPARRLYAARGFRMVGRRRGYYQHPDEDALVLRRDRPRTSLDTESLMG